MRDRSFGIGRCVGTAAWASAVAMMVIVAMASQHVAAGGVRGARSLQPTATADELSQAAPEEHLDVNGEEVDLDAISEEGSLGLTAEEQDMFLTTAFESLDAAEVRFAQTHSNAEAEGFFKKIGKIARKVGKVIKSLFGHKKKHKKKPHGSGGGTAKGFVKAIGMDVAKQMGKGLLRKIGKTIFGSVGQAMRNGQAITRRIGNWARDHNLDGLLPGMPQFNPNAPPTSGGQPYLTSYAALAAQLAYEQKLQNEARTEYLARRAAKKWRKRRGQADAARADILETARTVAGTIADNKYNAVPADALLNADEEHARKERERKAKEDAFIKQYDDGKSPLEELAQQAGDVSEASEERRDSGRGLRLSYVGDRPLIPGGEGIRYHSTEEVEDCFACKYIWAQVEAELGGVTGASENVHDSFTRNARDAMRTPIFYLPVQAMWDVQDDMVGDYLDGYSAAQICENSLLCRR